MSRPRARAALTALTLWAMATAGEAQTNDDANAGIQFNFSTPGARSLGLGGAFLGLADDATAAYTNPAGLTNLTLAGSEVSVELRRWRYSHLFPSRGHVGGPPTGIGVDTISGVEDSESESMVSGLSFLSFGYVLPQGWTLALYRHELVNFEAALERQGPLVGSGNRLERIRPARSAMDLQVVNFGAAAAFEWREGLSFGLGGSYYQCSFDARTERFDLADLDADNRVNRLPGGFFGPADFLGDNLYTTQLQQGEDTDWGFNAGLLWKFHGGFSLGATYRQGPDFEVDTVYLWGPRAEARNPGQINGRRDPSVGGRAVFHVPDVYGLGLAWSTQNGNVKLALDYDRIRYAQLTDDLTNLLVRDASDFQSSDFQVDDANELHAGFEYVFLALEAELIGTVRLGAWYDPAHSLKYTGTDSVLRTRFPARDDEFHLAAGVGLVIGENFQVDTAIDVSDRVSTLSFSFVKFL